MERRKKRNEEEKEKVKKRKNIVFPNPHSQPEVATRDL